MKLFFIPRLPKDKGFTLTEALLTITILAMVMVAMIPFIRTVHTTWSLGDRKSELQQNARVGLEMMSRLIRQAKRISSIPASGSGNFIKFRDSQDTQTIIFYQNIASSPYYIGNIGLIRDNDLVMHTIDINKVENNALLAKSLSNFRIDFKDAQGGLAAKPYDVTSMDISMSFIDPQGLIPDRVDIFSTISLRPEVRINKPVWVASGNYVVELSMDNWIAGFSSPYAVLVDASSNDCWVADTGNNQIKRISSTGTISTYVGFNEPRSVSVDPNANYCWVADTNNNSIKKLNLNGGLLLNISGFNHPDSVSVNSLSHFCWVADTGNNQVIKLDGSGNQVFDKPVKGFKDPRSLSVNPSDDSCWVADTAHDRIKKISSSGKLLVNKPGFKRPSCVSVDSHTGECWIADTGNNCIKKISSTGAVLFTITGFNTPEGVAVNPDDGSCWIADTGNNQVVKLDSQGNEEFRISGFQSPLSVGVIP